MIWITERREKWFFRKKNIIKEIYPLLGINLGYSVVEKNFRFNTVRYRYDFCRCTFLPSATRCHRCPIPTFSHRTIWYWLPELLANVKEIYPLLEISLGYSVVEKNFRFNTVSYRYNFSQCTFLPSSTLCHRHPIPTFSLYR